VSAPGCGWTGCWPARMGDRSPARPCPPARPGAPWAG
ncbi:MAG: hypothetical protein AVDCRST_MAG66-1849, partial [uncultured Pseudonocardia sp.]